MAFQDLAYQTSGPKAYQTALLDVLGLSIIAQDTPIPMLVLTEDVSLQAASDFGFGTPTSVPIRLRVFVQRPYTFPVLLPGENEPLAEPVIFFHKDALVNLDFTVLNPDGSVFNLTGTTVDLLAQPERGAALTFACVPTDPVNGKVRRVVAANDFAAGPYQAQLRVTAGSSVFHTIYFRILVAKAIV